MFPNFIYCPYIKVNQGISYILVTARMSNYSGLYVECVSDSTASLQIWFKKAFLVLIESESYIFQQ